MDDGGFIVVFEAGLVTILPMGINLYGNVFVIPGHYSRGKEWTLEQIESLDSSALHDNGG